MKSMIIVALALVAVAAALPVEQEPVPIVRSSNEQNPDGSYSFEYESADGSKRQEVGTPTQTVDEEGKPATAIFVRGTYSYVNPDGNIETIQYEADNNGFSAEGPSVPKVASR
ncbi:hypothetical protein PYW08_014779 [Mythimna loreyi]|uniref:Uncharacterized protein n=1 Tax=Mythimna loreyi TaxID=667449 RepID=A0ACC2R879_9NEOP|nr:hypothetical protein PYW08_014779 [Mythimna loreyi]